jgi:hypothetical protein
VCYGRCCGCVEGAVLGCGGVTVCVTEGAVVVLRERCWVAAE